MTPSEFAGLSINILVITAHVALVQSQSDRLWTNRSAYPHAALHHFTSPELVGECLSDDGARKLYDEYLLGGCRGYEIDGDPLPSTVPSYEAIAEGIVEMGGERHARLIEKLNAGHPIQVLALGGSQTKDNGGCWGRGCKRVCRYHQHCVSQLDNYDGPSIRAGKLQPIVTTGNMEPKRPLYQKFLTRFMQYVNATWPHPDHNLYNRGNNGQGAHNMIGCPDTYVSIQNADLVFMDHAVNHWNTSSVEHLLALVMKMPSKPAVVLLNFYSWYFNQPHKFRKQGTTPVGAGHFPDDIPKMRERLQEHMSNPSNVDAQAAALARKWGLADLSLFHALAPVYLDEKTTLPGPLWPMYKVSDGTHGRPRDGFEPYNIYIGDLIIHWLHTVSSNRELLSSTVGIDEVPPLPDRTVVGCLAWGSAGSHAPLSIKLTPGRTDEIPERYRSELAINEDQDTRAAWFVSDHPLDGSERVKKRLTPGLVSIAPGGSIDLKLAGTVPIPLGTSLLEISYLTSYQNMGKAMIECLEGCRCEEIVLDGHVDEGYTLPKVAELALENFTAACVLRLTNLARNDTHDGTKFKITQISAMIAAKTSDIQSSS